MRNRRFLEKKPSFRERKLGENLRNISRCSQIVIELLNYKLVMKSSPMQKMPA